MSSKSSTGERQDWDEAEIMMLFLLNKVNKVSQLVENKISEAPVVRFPNSLGCEKRVGEPE